MHNLVSQYDCVIPGTCVFNPITTAKGLLTLMMFLLQAQRFDQSSFLLRCGDIESNPGPGLHPGKFLTPKGLIYNFKNNCIFF